MALKVLMMGTSPEGKGGIATVVQVLRQAGFFEQEQARYVVSHAEGTTGYKLRVALAACWQVLSVSLRERPAVVHVHCASDVSFYRKSVLLALARLCRRDTVFHLHGAEFQQFVHRHGPIGRWWIRRTLRKSSAVIALSESWATFLRGLEPAAAVRVVANSVRVPASVSTEREQPARILFLGRADVRKGIFELLAAVAQLAPAFPAIRLIIGGDGALEQVAKVAAELGISDRVEILGWIGSAQRQAELDQAAVFCLPSFDEGLPMAMLESMAAAKAVVVTPVGGIPEVIVDGVNGILVPPGDPAGLAAGLRRLFEDEALRRRVADGARATIVGGFGTDVVMGKISALYRELAQARRH